MFETLSKAPGDKILALMGEYAADPRTDKIDLGVGVYKDEKGVTPIMSAVRKAEERAAIAALALEIDGECDALAHGIIAVKDQGVAGMQGLMLGDREAAPTAPITACCWSATNMPAPTSCSPA